MKDKTKNANLMETFCNAKAGDCLSLKVSINDRGEVEGQLEAKGAADLLGLFLLIGLQQFEDEATESGKEDLVRAIVAACESFAAFRGEEEDE